MTHEHRLHAGTREALEQRARKELADWMDYSASDITRLADFAEGETAPLRAALSDISARKAVLIEAYGFTEQTETEGATEIDDGWDAATMRGWGEWCAIISLEDILKGEK